MQLTVAARVVAAAHQQQHAVHRGGISAVPVAVRDADRPPMVCESSTAHICLVIMNTQTSNVHSTVPIYQDCGD